MAIALNTLPVEILDQICKSLPRHRDVSNFRLACHRLADVGLPALLPRLTVQLFPESLDRLCNIASDPVLKHHVFIIVFVMDIFDPEDSTLDEWKDKLAEMAEDIHPHLDFDMLEDEEEMRSSWEGLRLLLSRQNEAFTALESPRVQDALQQFRNLNNLEVRYSKRQDRTSRDETYRKIYEAHPYIHKESQPFYPSYTGTTYAGRPGIKPLKALLRGIGKPGLRTLRVEALDAQFFNGNVAAEAAEFDSLLGSLRDLNTLRLTVTHCAETVESAESGLSTDRFRTFLSSAPHLEDIDVGFGDTDLISFYPKVANVLPVEYTWPNLTRLRLSVVEIVPPTFLNFLRRQRSLETLELGHCQLPEGSTHSWSDLFAPLAVDFDLKKLALSGTFGVQRPTGWDYIDIRDAVDDMELQVCEALDMVVCSREFDKFLHNEVAMHNDLDVGAVKQGIIRSLMDSPPARAAEITMRIPTDYAHYFKSFASVTDSSNWGKGGMWVSGYERILRPVREAPEAPRF
ncbi:unnamed protein product [Clonostachys byssicola]|uniref:F-box domain-containing protein n=1 Tax=Clonostachys byssicola TaxID=160290 RepID=A0A9N9U678_9HYPO|nr:unnamed protein product [Clonostachys byssicola]